MDDNNLIVLEDSAADTIPDVSDAPGEPSEGSEGETMDSTLDGDGVTGVDAASETDLSTVTDVPLSPSVISGTVSVDNLWERPIMTTSLNDYTVTEGLLLLIFLVLAVR